MAVGCKERQFWVKAYSYAKCDILVNLIPLFLQRDVSELLYQSAVQNGCTYSSVCGVPYTALPLATVRAISVF